MSKKNIHNEWCVFHLQDKDTSEEWWYKNIVSSVTGTWNTILTSHELWVYTSNTLPTFHKNDVSSNYIKSQDIINEYEKQMVLWCLMEEFGDSLLSVAIFWSSTSNEDGMYSDYDMFILLTHYRDDNIYQREKSSPRLKEKLQKVWICSLFAFNFTTIEELENAQDSNPWLLETIGKSFCLLKDDTGILEKILTKDRGVKYMWNFVWEWKSLNTKKNRERIESVLDLYKNILFVAIQNNYTDYRAHYEWEVEKMKIIRQLLEKKLLFVSRFDFDFIGKEGFYWDQNERECLFQTYKKAVIEGKRILHDYDSIENNIDFSEVLKSNNLVLPSLQHKYIALKNIFLELLHKTWNFILDGEITQKFLQIFRNSLPQKIRDTLYEYSYKTEQILGRTGYVSFDVQQNGDFLFEEWKGSYEDIFQALDILIEYLLENKQDIAHTIWEKETKISIITQDTNFWHHFLFPNTFQIYSRKEIEYNCIPSALQESEYIFILNNQNEFSPDYLLKLLSGFNKKWVKCVSWKRISPYGWLQNTFHNFVFKKEDYIKEGRNIFTSSPRRVGTQYFTS